jgi:hypothetical protein
MGFIIKKSRGKGKKKKKKKKKRLKLERRGQKAFGGQKAFRPHFNIASIPAPIHPM